MLSAAPPGPWTPHPPSRIWPPTCCPASHPWFALLPVSWSQGDLWAMNPPRHFLKALPPSGSHDSASSPSSSQSFEPREPIKVLGWVSHNSDKTHTESILPTMVLVKALIQSMSMLPTNAMGATHPNHTRNSSTAAISLPPFSRDTSSLPFSGALHPSSLLLEHNPAFLTTTWLAVDFPPTASKYCPTDNYCIFPALR